MRPKTINSIYNMSFTTLPFTGIWREVFGEPEDNGAWLLYGTEKQGKTTLALMLAKYLCTFKEVLYISGEEGFSKNIQETCMRVNIPAKSAIRISEYVPIVKLEEKLHQRRSPSIIILDNFTIYSDELTYGRLNKLLKDFPDKLFVCIAHEEKGLPYTSSAKLCAKLAKVKIHIKGLAAFVEGRCPGGHIVINEEKAQLYWGNELSESRFTALEDLHNYNKSTFPKSETLEKAKTKRK